MAGINRDELIKSLLNETALLEDEEEVIDLLVKEKVSRNINTLHSSGLSLGDKMADKLAKIAGSWRFVLIFVGVIAVWIAFNAAMPWPFDAYPFILLNLMLSCVAAIQAPVIMMSQNRQEEKDRLRAQNDYKVNIKSELIIEDLHKKLDQLLENQNKLLEKLEGR
jgi:uncharacterized membrane protein